MSLTKQEIVSNIDEIFGLYEHFGNEEYGENVTQMMHMMQSANYAIRDGATDELIIAAFLHDIGHFIEQSASMNGYGRHDHDRLGGEYLRNKGFSQHMANLVASHVAVKRYLTYKDSDYYQQLSDASKITLDFQGGPMSEDEAAIFEADPMKDQYIQIRLWDDLGKDEDVSVCEEDVLKMKERIKAYLIAQHVNSKE